MKIKKDFKLKIMPVIIGALFLFNTEAYSLADTLRFPLVFSGKESKTTKLIQIFLGERQEHFWVERTIESTGINLSHTSLRLESHHLDDFARVLNAAADEFDVIVLSPSHSNPTALYYRNEEIEDDIEKITLLDLKSLRGRVDLKGACIILDGCWNVDLASAFILLGARGVYAHNRSDFGVDLYRIFRHMKDGKPLPDALIYVVPGSRHCRDDL